MKYLILLFLVISNGAHALSIADIQGLAIQNSELLKAKEMEQHALASEGEWRSKWVNPQLMGQFGTLRSGDKIGATIEISLLQAVPLSNKYSLRKELVTEALKAQTKRNVIFKNFVSHQAVLAAWRVFTQERLVEHGSERTRRIKLIKKYMESRPKVSVRQQVEMNVLSAILLSYEKLLDQKVFDLGIAQAELEYWVGKKVDPKELDFKFAKVSAQAIPGIDVEQDPELLEARFLLSTSQFEFELAKKERRPDLFLGGGYRIENVEPVNHFTYGTIGLNIPIWDTGRERVAMSKARLMGNEKNIEDAKRRIRSKQQKQIENVLFSAKQVQRFNPEHLHSQERAVDVAEDGFKKGLIDVNLFLQSETQAHEAIDLIYMSWMEYLDNLSLLQLMRGENLSWEKL